MTTWDVPVDPEDGDEYVLCGQMLLGDVPSEDPPCCVKRHGHDGDHEHVSPELDSVTWEHPD